MFRIANFRSLTRFTQKKMFEVEELCRPPNPPLKPNRA